MTPQEKMIEDADERWRHHCDAGNAFFAYKCIHAAHDSVLDVHDSLPGDSECREQLEYILSWLRLDESEAPDDAYHHTRIFESSHPTVELSELGGDLARAMEGIRDAHFSPELTEMMKAQLTAAYVFVTEAQLEKARCGLHPFGPAAERPALPV